MLGYSHTEGVALPFLDLLSSRIERCGIEKYEFVVSHRFSHDLLEASHVPLPSKSRSLLMYDTSTGGIQK